MLIFIDHSAAFGTSLKHTPLSVKEGSITVDGRDRQYYLYIPQGGHGRGPFPLVFVLHGGGGQALKIMQKTRMNELAAEHGFIVVYPNGTGAITDRGLTWNAGGNCCGYAFENNVNDVKFIDQLIDRLQQDYSIDSKRIYATGMSNGGMMVYRLASELSHKLAAIAPVEGAMNNENPNPSQPVSLVIFHGDADERVKYNGGPGASKRNKRIDKPVSYAVDFWVKFNRCSAAPQKQEAGNHILDNYTGCKDGTGVALYTIKGGKHAWPGSATQLMWEFFEAHPKR